MTAAFQTLAQTLESLEIGQPTTRHNLSVFPLLGLDPDDSPA
ncbi:MAG: hypothetical protein RMI94_12130 [Bryobacterales bacterium]|nr:hypothetical protein [Bryobacterales bacterium]